MAQRSFWKGYLKLSLVTCAVSMTPALSESEKVRFHTLNRKTGNRVVSRYIDSGSGKPVAEDEAVKGYPRGDDEYVMLDDDELEAVALESTRTIDIETFVPIDSIDWIWYDRPHYLTPDDKVGEEAYSVIRDAMAATNTGGIARVVMYRRERAVLLKPHDNGIVVWTLRYGDEVRDGASHWPDLSKNKPDQKLLRLVSQLIDERTRPWDPSMAEDPVQDKLLDIIAAKKKGRKRPAARKSEPAPPTNVINIMDALKKSIASEKRTKGR
ncbi:MAG: Ku protein [Chelatococcus sp.]|uniref:non-homologous end joining protein Ku n=1 Tax=Chelatococcus sp. TaxID=1953771 RepID=UPI0025C66DFA|nr:Ku protein [Chelatococcus sp.]MBX3540993.1 Ku protein [Chelatococcus sp.]